MIDFDPLMNGQRLGPLAATMRGGLWFASLGYRTVVGIRNRRFDKGINVQRMDVPVLCIGNLTTGGTGKTPVVCAIATRLRRRSIRVAIVSRGYGRGDAAVNDEALELYDRLPDVPHVQDPDRVAAATIATEELQSQFILMDDGFGHRRLHRDADIILVDSTRPFGYGYLLPRGLLREPISSVRRASLVILTRCDLVSGDRLEEIQATIRTYFNGPILTSRHVAGSLRDYQGTQIPLETIRNQSVGLVSAIGNPDAFERSVETLGVNVVSHRRLPDHAAMNRETMAELRTWADAEAVETILCTHKDLVKLQVDRLGGKPLLAVQIDLQLNDPNGDLDQLLVDLQQSLQQEP